MADPGFRSLFDGLLEGLFEGFLEVLLEHSRASCGVGGLNHDEGSLRIRIWYPVEAWRGVRGNLEREPPGEVLGDPSSGPLGRSCRERSLVKRSPSLGSLGRSCR